MGTRRQSRQHHSQAVGQEWGQQMERGPTSTNPDGPLIFSGSSPADVELARVFWNTAILPPLFESSLGPTNLRHEGPSSGQTPSPGQTLAHRQTPTAAHSAQKAEAKERYRQQGQKKEEILALLRKQREERVAKELISRPHKPKMRSDQVSRQKAFDTEHEDREAVKALG